MRTCQTGRTFLAELRDMGLVLPDGAQSIRITCNGPNDIVYLVVESVPDRRNVVIQEKFPLIDEEGDSVSVQEFFQHIREIVQLPDQTMSFDIWCRWDEIVTVLSVAALPENSFSKLKEAGYSFK